MTVKEIGNYKLYFGQFENWGYRYTNKKTGKALKTPVYDCLVENGLQVVVNTKVNGEWIMDYEKTEEIKNLHLEYNEENISKVMRMF